MLTVGGAAYQSFLKQLLLAAGGPACGSTAKSVQLDERTAVRCMNGLLEALPHFNYRSDLLSALVPRLSGVDAEAASFVCHAVATLLSTAGHAEAALEAVQLLAEHVKATCCRCPPWTLDVLESLRFDDRLSTRLRAERDAAKGKPLSQKDRNRKWIEQRRTLRDEAKRGARNAHAAAPDEADPGNDRSLRDLDALPDVTELVKLQTRTLEAVCEIYFRVLKAAVVAPTNSPLLGATLAGLARVAPLIDYEVVADLLDVLRSLLETGLLAADMQARCLLAACDVLSGQVCNNRWSCVCRLSTCLNAGKRTSG